MKNKLTLISMCMTGILLSHASHSSDMRDFEPVPHVSFKKALVLGLLASSGLSHAQDLRSIKPYRELNMSAYLIKNYEGDMPSSYRATIKYSYVFPMVNGAYNSGSAAASDTYCLMQQAKVERSFEIRKVSNAMYIAAQRPEVPEPDRYSMIASAINIELASHMLEMEAAKLATITGSCAIPTPMV